MSDTAPALDQAVQGQGGVVERAFTGVWEVYSLRDNHAYFLWQHEEADADLPYHLSGSLSYHDLVEGAEDGFASRREALAFLGVDEFAAPAKAG